MKTKDLFYAQQVEPEYDETLHYLRSDFAKLGVALMELPDNRYRSLALTQLEAAAMWATKACTHHEGEK